MNIAKQLFLLTCCSVIALPALAQERHLTEAEITELFDQMYLKHELSIDTDEVELEDEQREQIAEEILEHYTEELTMKFKHQVIADDGTVGRPFQVNLNRMELKYGIAKESDIKNLKVNYKINDIDFKGQRAIVYSTAIYTYDIDMTDYDHDPEMTADAIGKDKCEYHIKIDFDDMARITYENCTTKTLISNIEMHDESDYKEAARFLCNPPKRKATYILNAYEPAGEAL